MTFPYINISAVCKVRASKTELFKFSFFFFVTPTEKRKELDDSVLNIQIWKLWYTVYCLFTFNLNSPTVLPLMAFTRLVWSVVPECKLTCVLDASIFSHRLSSHLRQGASSQGWVGRQWRLWGDILHLCEHEMKGLNTPPPMEECPAI